MEVFIHKLSGDPNLQLPYITLRNPENLATQRTNKKSATLSFADSSSSLSLTSPLPTNLYPIHSTHSVPFFRPIVPLALASSDRLLQRSIPLHRNVVKPGARCTPGELPHFAVKLLHELSAHNGRKLAHPRLGGKFSAWLQSVVLDSRCLEISLTLARTWFSSG